MKLIFYSGLLLMILFSSCATTNRATITPESRRDLNNIVGNKFDTDQKGSDIKDPDGNLSLNEALQLALLQNPNLAVFALEIRAREAARLQASLLPNPEISLETENFSGSGVYGGFDATETTISIGQLFELGGKRQNRVELANLNMDLAAWEYESMRIEVYALVIDSYTQLLALQEKLILDKELLAVAEKLASTIDKRVTAGRLSPAEKARAAVAVSDAKISISQTEQQIKRGQRKLAATWNGTGNFESVSGVVKIIGNLPNLKIIQSALEKSPAIASWAIEMDRRRASVQLSKSLSVPDPNIRLAFRRINESDDNAFMAGVSIPLPIFNRNQGGIKEAEVRVRQADWQYKSRLNNLKTQVEGGYYLAKAYQLKINALKENSIPNAEVAFKIINQGYQLGKFQLIDVLDAQRTLFEARQQLLETTRNYILSINEIERITGQNLNNL